MTAISRSRTPRGNSPVAGDQGTPTVELSEDFQDQLLLVYERVVSAFCDTDRPCQADLDELKSVGATAARHGIGLKDLIDTISHGSSTVQHRSVVHMPDGGPASLIKACHQAIVALSAGHAETLREGTCRQSDAERFLAALMNPHHDVQSLLDIAERIGFQQASEHFVAIVRAKEPSLGVSATFVQRLRASMVPQMGAILIMICKHRDDVVIVCRDEAGAAARLSRAMSRFLDSQPARSSRASLGRPWPGLRGVPLSYQDACDGFELGSALSPASVVELDNLLLSRVLVRDRFAMADLIRSVLMPLTEAKDGPEPMLETLETYFRCGLVTTVAAKELFLSVRAVTYRLERIRRLTGYDVDSYPDRLKLETALAGARILDWPNMPLPKGD